MNEKGSSRQVFDGLFLKKFWFLMDKPNELDVIYDGHCMVRWEEIPGVDCPSKDGQTACCACPICVRHFSAIRRDVERRYPEAKIEEIPPENFGDKGLEFVLGNRKIVLQIGFGTGSCATYFIRRNK